MAFQTEASNGQSGVYGQLKREQLMENTSTRMIKDMVTEDFRTAAVFEKYSIDFCCGGKKPLETACLEQGIDLNHVLADLRDLNSIASAGGTRFADWDLDFLADYIVQNHHLYLRRIIPSLTAHTEKIAGVHGKNHPELAAIAAHFSAVANELAGHMVKEERILFPYISVLAAAKRDGITPERPPFQTLRNPIRMMEAEHQSAGEGLAFIRSTSQGYTVPPDGCTTYRLTYQELEEFERDLHQHVHLENNILFPKAIQLEEELMTSSR
jgi:regulator of cell morphogenesis and NO signaling